MRPWFCYIEGYIEGIDVFFVFQVISLSRVDSMGVLN